LYNKTIFYANYTVLQISYTKLIRKQLTMLLHVNIQSCRPDCQSCAQYNMQIIRQLYIKLHNHPGRSQVGIN